MRRAWTVSAIIVLVAGVAVASFFGGRASRSAGPTMTSTAPLVTTTTAVTQQMTLNPFSPRGLGPGVRVVFQTTASCENGSEADSSRADAYRCFLTQSEPNGGNIADPCFSDPFGSLGYLLCFESPVDLNAVEVEPTNAIGVGQSTPDSPPWALKLTNGQFCVFITGATAALGNERLNYGCPKGDVYGDPDRSQPQWTVSYQPNGSSQLVSVRVAISYT
jgi:hypothetical protein